MEIIKRLRSCSDNFEKKIVPNINRLRNRNDKLTAKSKTENAKNYILGVIVFGTRLTTFGADIKSVKRALTVLHP